MQTRTGGQPRCRKYPCAPVGTLQRRHHPRPVTLEIFSSEPAAGLAHVIDQRGRQIAAIKILRAGVAQPRQRVGEIS